MGERLVIEFKRNDEIVASSYYHWSAYTVPALNILLDMQKHLLPKTTGLSNEEFKLALIRYAEKCCSFGYIDSEDEKEKIESEFLSRFDETDPDDASNNLAKSIMKDIIDGHGGICGKDIELARTLFPDEEFSLDGVDRNDGLVGLSKESIESFNEWAQAVVVVDLDEGRITNGCVYEYSKEDYIEELEAYLEEMEEYDDMGYDMPELEEVERVPIDLSNFLIEEIIIAKDIIESTDEKWLRYEDKIFEIIEG